MKTLPRPQRMTMQRKNKGFTRKKGDWRSRRLRLTSSGEGKEVHVSGASCIAVQDGASSQISALAGRRTRENDRDR